MSHNNISQSAESDSALNNSHRSPRNGHDSFDSQHAGEGGKKAGHPGDGTFFKILVPSVAAGAIIGKGGETIAQLQQQTQTRIKMSKATDFFPGTNERVCIIYGADEDGILQVYDFIAQKIREKPDPVSKPAVDFDPKQPAEREKQVKILVPNSTAGMIIGKSGNYIKHIKEESGAYVQISQKAKDHAITERCITIIGDSTSNRKACALILTKIFEDPQSNTCPNLSYADIVGPVPNYNPTGSPFANVHHVPMDPNGMPFTPNPHHFLNTLRNTLRISGYSEEATAEIIAAMTTLASYGILGLGLLGGLGMGYVQPMAYDPSYGHGNGSTGVSSSPMGGSPAGYPDSVASHGGSSSISPIRLNGQYDLDGNGSGNQSEQSSFQQYSRSDMWNNNRNGHWGPEMSPSFVNGGDAVVPVSKDGQKSQVSMDINDNLVGTLYGRDGKGLVEIQERSGAAVELFPKKFQLQGRRTLSISGSPGQINIAQTLIQQRLHTSLDEKRSDHPSLSSSPQQMPMSPASQYS